MTINTRLQYKIKLLQMKNIVLLPLILLSLSVFSQNKEVYKIFLGDGRVSSYDSLLNACKDASFVFFGEQHDNPIAHWLEYELTVDLYKFRKNELVVGAEMFEADNQLILCEYLQGKISDKKFEEEARLWPNYKTDYKPFMQYCKENKIPFIATNIPRRYASMVHYKGLDVLDSLSSEAKSYIAPLPINYDDSISYYKNMLKEMDNEHATPNIPKAQAIKDATMAYFILRNHKRGELFLHFNGSHHSNNHQGIVTYLKAEKKKFKVIVINTVTQKNISTLSDEIKYTGDFIICVTENMTKTY